MDGQVLVVVLAGCLAAGSAAPANPHYQFSYGVSDSSTGDVKTHSETRVGGTVRGSYSLLEPGGTRRVVHYTADDVHGFNVIVQREGQPSQPVRSVVSPRFVSSVGHVGQLAPLSLLSAYASPTAATAAPPPEPHQASFLPSPSYAVNFGAAPAFAEAIPSPVKGYVTAVPSSTAYSSSAPVTFRQEHWPALLTAGPPTKSYPTPTQNSYAVSTLNSYPPTLNSYASVMPAINSYHTAAFDPFASTVPTLNSYATTLKSYAPALSSYSPTLNSYAPTLNSPAASVPPASSYSFITTSLAPPGQVQQVQQVQQEVQQVQQVQQEVQQVPVSLQSLQTIPSPEHLRGALQFQNQEGSQIILAQQK